MYNLPYFTEENKESVLDFMQKNSFVNIAGYDGDYPVSTHVPVDIKKVEEKNYFDQAHNEGYSHYNAFVQNENVLVIFNRPHCYISASWYVKKMWLLHGIILMYRQKAK